MNNIFDPQFNGMPGSEFYRSQVMPDLFPHEKPMDMRHWPAEERAVMIGGEEAKAFYREEIKKVAA